jgi:hypothetical protein
LSAHFVAAASTMGFLRWWPELCSFSIAGKSWLEVACKKSTKDDALIHQVFFWCACVFFSAVSVAGLQWG